MLGGIFNTSSSSAVHKVATKSILSSLLWLTGILIAPLTYGALAVGPMQVGFMGLLVVLVVTDIGAYLFFAWKSPDRLQSEEYLLENRRIEYGLLGDDRKPAPVVDAEVVANTHVLSSGTTE